MKNIGFFSNRWRLIIPAIIGLLIWASAPVLLPSNAASATDEPDSGVTFVASLTGAAINNVPSNGHANYFQNTDNTVRILNVNVNLNLANNTLVKVFIGTNEVGTITMRRFMGVPFASGSLRLDTIRGNTVPTIASGNAISVKNGDVTVLTGTFGPPPTPTPWPSVSPSGTRTPTPTPSGTRTPTPTPSGSPSPTPTPAPAHLFKADLFGRSMVPPVTTFGRGMARFYLNENDTQLTVFLSYSRLSSAATSATINGPATTTANGPTIFTIPDLTGTVGIVPPKTFDVTPAQVAQLRAGQWYIVIKTVNNTAGEVRGQILRLNGRGIFGGPGGLPDPGDEDTKKQPEN